MRKTKEKEIKVLTDLEKKFAELFVDNYYSQDTKTNTELAKLSGYAPESAYQRGYENTTYRIKPHVVESDHTRETHGKIKSFRKTC